jgi:hypothetical protein
MSRFSRPITDWSVENINPDMTLSMMLDASISSEEKRILRNTTNI